MTKVIDSTWFHSYEQNYGMVLIENDTGERKVYLGPARWNDPEQDIQHIMQNGAPVHIDHLLRFLERAKKK